MVNVESLLKKMAINCAEALNPNNVRIHKELQVSNANCGCHIVRLMVLAVSISKVSVKPISLSNHAL